MCLCCKIRPATWHGHCGPCVDEVNRIPLWVALRWLFTLVFRGFDAAERVMRPQDRVCQAKGN
jgi:hypothetical protein